MGCGASTPTPPLATPGPTTNKHSTESPVNLQNPHQSNGAVNSHNDKPPPPDASSSNGQQSLRHRIGSKQHLVISIHPSKSIEDVTRELLDASPTDDTDFAATPEPLTPYSTAETPEHLQEEEELRWKDYLKRQRAAQDELQALAKTVKPLIPVPLHEVAAQQGEDGEGEIDSVRPFLSSTFRDFNAERDILVSTTFPRIDKLCRDRGVFFAPLDLRWGVTSEQSGSGQVIKICLEEIDRSRPYFIGSLGFRNGWCLSTEYRDELLETTFELAEAEFDWVASRRDRSVTELEMLHGALNDPQAAARSLFYFRDVSFLEELPRDKRSMYTDVGGPNEDKVLNLKRAIVEAGFAVKWFGSPNAMADQLEEDLVTTINRDFPPERVQSILQRELKDHKSFADMRTRVYVGGDAYLAQLDEYLFAEGARRKPVVVYGPSGIGKSALLANWTRSLRTRARSDSLPGKFNDALLITRYIGATPASTTVAPLIRWILEEIVEFLASRELDTTAPSSADLPESAKELVEALPDWLERAAQHAPVVLILDSLTSLAHEDQASLKWLPHVLPERVFLVTSSVNDQNPYVELVEKRQWTPLEVSPLTDSSCQQLMKDFLGHYGKQVDEEQNKIVLDCPRTRRPLYLCTFLQELRDFGVYEKVNDRIRHYLESRTVTDLFTKVLERLEEDFDPQVPNMVRGTLSLLYVSRQGLNERELKEALHHFLGLQRSGEAFPLMPFSAMMLRLDQSLIDQRGLRNFSHSYMRDAVKRRYMKPPRNLECHRLLAEYWQAQPEATERKAEELPYHLWLLASKAIGSSAAHHRRRQPSYTGPTGDYDSMLASMSTKHSPGGPESPMLESLRTLQNVSSITSGRGLDPLPEDLEPVSPGGQDESGTIVDAPQALIDCLCDLELFERLIAPNNRYDLHKYWQLLEKSSVTDVGEAYSAALTQYAVRPDADPLDYAQKCEEVATFLIDTDRYGNDDSTAAVVYLQACLDVRSKRMGADHPELERILTKQALLLTKQGRHHEALPIYERSLAIVDKTYGKGSLRATVLLTNIAGVLKEQGKFDESLKMYRQALESKIALVGPSNAQVAISQVNLAELYLRLGRAEEALELFQNARTIIEDTYGLKHPQVATVLSSLASAYMKCDPPEYDKSLELYERARAIKEEALGPDHVGVAVVLQNMATNHHGRGDLDTALKLYERSLAIREKAQGKRNPALAATLENIALLYAEQGPVQQSTAITYYRRALELKAKTLGKSHPQCAELLVEIARLQKRLSLSDDAVATMNQALASLERTYGKQSVELQAILHELGDLLQNENMAMAHKLFVREVTIVDEHLKQHRLDQDEDMTNQQLTALSGALLAAGATLLGLADLGDDEEDEDEDPTEVAKQYLDRALELRVQLFGESDSRVDDVREWLEMCDFDDEDLGDDDDEDLEDDEG